MVPTTDGGMGLDLLTLAVTAETLAYHGAPAPVTGNALAAWLISSAGSGGTARALGGAARQRAINRGVRPSRGGSGLAAH